MMHARAREDSLESFRRLSRRRRDFLRRGPVISFRVATVEVATGTLAISLDSHFGNYSFEVHPFYAFSQFLLELSRKISG